MTTRFSRARMGFVIAFLLVAGVAGTTFAPMRKCRTGRLRRGQRVRKILFRRMRPPLRLGRRCLRSNAFRAMGQPGKGTVSLHSL